MIVKELVANIQLDDSYQNLLVELSYYIKENILSEASLDCTQKVIEINEGHYTAWSFRRKILFSLCFSLENELKFIRSFTLETPKNYQLWQHRQIITDNINDMEVFSKDLEDTKVQLSLDAKNIHCWQYRQWLFSKIPQSFDSEFQYAESLLRDDIFNNSAWNYRYWLIKHSENYKNNKNQCLIDEFNNILSFLNKSSEDNECFWNYLAILVQDCDILDFKDTVITKLIQIIGPYNDSENHLYLKFLVRFDEEKVEICEKLKKIRPINRALWSMLSRN